MKTQLHFETQHIAGKTILTKNYATPPLKLANITENKANGPLHLMMMSSSPGVLDGDSYEVHGTIGNQCTVTLSTQSYQRLFTMQGHAVQSTTINIGENAAFTYLPHPMVPHAGSSFASVNHIYLASTSKLIWGEIITCGRKQNGEAFHFTKLQLQTKVYVEGKLQLFENMLVEPANTPLQSIGHWENFTHQASFIYIDPLKKQAETQEVINVLLQNIEGVTYGTTATQANGVLVRMLGHKAEQLFAILKTFAAQVAHPLQVL